MLRASGDSKRPTYFLLASSFLNIALDYVFITLIPMGVTGTALATVLSQLVSDLGELIGRTLGGGLAVTFFGFTRICFANPLAWFFALLYCFLLVFRFLRKNRKSQK